MNHIVLLGDSIFDNASYVPGKPAVIEQLRHRLPGNCEATLLAVDGDVTSDVMGQTDRLPKVPVIDLRLVCNESTDYSEISSIEPSASGGEKIAQTIVKLIERHDFTKDQSVIYF
jgi:hypothetical protein